MVKCLPSGLTTRCKFFFREKNHFKFNLINFLQRLKINYSIDLYYLFIITSQLNIFNFIARQIFSLPIRKNVAVNLW